MNFLKVKNIWSDDWRMKFKCVFFIDFIFELLNYFITFLSYFQFGIFKFLKQFGYWNILFDMIFVKNMYIIYKISLNLIWFNPIKSNWTRSNHIKPWPKYFLVQLPVRFKKIAILLNMPNSLFNKFYWWSEAHLQYFGC